KFYLSSTNATKIYFDLDMPEVVYIKERSSHKTPPREITLPARGGYFAADPSITEARKTIADLLESGNQDTMYSKAIGVAAEKGWYYLGCQNCTTKLVGGTGDLWCPSCKAQVNDPVPRYLLRLEVEDPTGTAIFVAMDHEIDGLATVKAAFAPIMNVMQDYLISVTPYNAKHPGSPTFTVSKLPTVTPTPLQMGSSQGEKTVIPDDGGATAKEPGCQIGNKRDKISVSTLPPESVLESNVGRPAEDAISDDEPARKKPFMGNCTDNVSETTKADE
ncbi:hypothetical protein MKW94_002525, partial [Papaver nudicaule]|nr:hypothetical protein [Papaver nudicaule]